MDPEARVQERKMSKQEGLGEGSDSVPSRGGAEAALQTIHTPTPPCSPASTLCSSKPDTRRQPRK